MTPTLDAKRPKKLSKKARIVLYFINFILLTLFMFLNGSVGHRAFEYYFHPKHDDWRVFLICLFGAFFECLLTLLLITAVLLLIDKFYGRRIKSCRLDSFRLS